MLTVRSEIGTYRRPSRLLRSLGEFLVHLRQWKLGLAQKSFEPIQSVAKAFEYKTKLSN
jgi:hypothetical protein